MIIVSDTSCLSNLIQINQLNLLQKLYKTILIPPTVYEELNAFHLPDELNLKDHGIFIQSPQNTIAVNELMAELDAGESESIILAEELKADYLLVDERKATKIANHRGLTTIGLLGVILLAKQYKHINFVKPLLDDLKLKTTFRYSGLLYNKLLHLANEQ